MAVSSKRRADGGKVTLRGTVGSFREKREAKQAAQRVYGVTDVEDDLDVRILTENRRDDADLRGAVLQALTLDAFVPTTIDAGVTDGMVTLTGTAEWQYQRGEAGSPPSPTASPSRTEVPSSSAETGKHRG